jgi:hypothetical protein
MWVCDKKIFVGIGVGIACIDLVNLIVESVPPVRARHFPSDARKYVEYGLASARLPAWGYLCL